MLGQASGQSGNVLGQTATCHPALFAIDADSFISPKSRVSSLDGSTELGSSKTGHLIGTEPKALAFWNRGD
jgi:hypothetical protein